MEAVGTLAGGVAHDFNNQLSVILGNARFVRENVSEDSDLCDAMTDLERAGEYCAQLTRQLLSFSRHVPVEPRAISVSEVLQDVGELTAPLLSSDIGFEAVAHDDLDSVFVDRIQLQQVLVNLVVNARDAMPDGGNLSIRTALCDIGSTEAAHLHLPEPGVYVEFVVSDTGSGMDDATIGRIYEPFFTTKEQGKGTGLGLATVYGILKESGGAIQVDSALGEGTTFRILLPRPEEDSAENSPDFRVGARGGETLLLVEDDAGVRRLMRRMLGRMGFQVLQAANGEEAIRIGQTHEGDIDVLVSDVSMPGIGGVELGRQLLESRPSLRVLLLTAHGMDKVNLPGARTLGMPFRQEELGWALDSLLRG
jgi:CheY-like chemotaxis protein